MQRKLPRTPVLFIAIIIFLHWGCTKIDTTTLGSDLIPAIDNVHTFADTLDITTSQGLFDDSSRVLYSDLHVLGSITNDPVFGKTKSDLYVQLKPNYFPFYFGNIGDTINSTLNNKTGFDSAVLCLSYSGFYGDTTKRQTFTVYEINSSTTNFGLKDSSYKLNFLPDAGLGAMLGQVTILPTDVRRYTYFKGSNKDSINNQIRIPLSNDYLQNTLLANLDTSSATNSIYRSDSLFKTKMKGFAIIASGGEANGLFYVDVTNAATRLEIHYRKSRNNVVDTSYSTFSFSTGYPNSFSAQATHLERDRNGAEMNTPSSDAIYLQSTPGTYALLHVPGISAYDNRIIHRAEIVVEEIPGASIVDSAMQPPAYLYLDLVDTPSSANRFKTIYFDLNPDVFYNPDDSIYFYPTSGVSFGYYGGYLRKKTVAGISNYYYTFNVSRYLQHIVTNHLNNYSFRLYAPNKIRYNGYSIAYRNQLANGRIKVGSGTHPNYKMYMRVVFSKL